MKTATADYLKSAFMPRPSDCHKGDFGQVCVIGGSAYYVGAPQFAAESSRELNYAAGSLCGCGVASMLSGCGTSVLAVPDFLADKLYSNVRFSAIYPLKSDGKKLTFDKRQLDCLMKKCTAFVIGPGTADGETDKIAEYILKEGIQPVIIDADALIKTAPFKFGGRAVLTPHIGEMSALTGLSPSQIKADAAEICRRYAFSRDCVCVLKGFETYISDGEAIYTNSNGNAKLAKGGSGDVLCGIIGALAARGIDLLKSAVCGCYILGRCAELSRVNEYSHLPDDIIGKISDVVTEIMSFK